MVLPSNHIVYIFKEAVMKIYIEVWKAKEAWTKLIETDRQNYLAQLAPAIQHCEERRQEKEMIKANEFQGCTENAFCYA